MRKYRDIGPTWRRTWTTSGRDAGRSLLKRPTRLPGRYMVGLAALCLLSSCSMIAIRPIKVMYDGPRQPREQVAFVGLCVPPEEFESESVCRPPAIVRVNSQDYTRGAYAVELLPGRHVIKWEVIPEILKYEGLDGVRYFTEDVTVEANGVYAIECTGGFIDITTLESHIVRQPMQYTDLPASLYARKAGETE